MTLIWHWPQITWTLIVCLGNASQCFDMAKRGNVAAFAIQMLLFVLVFWLLYNGGFWAGAKP